MSSHLGIAEVIDLELQLELDRSLPAEELHARDRPIGLALDAGLPVPVVLSTWLASLRARVGRSSLGASLVRGSRILAAILVVLGLSIGSGVARALMHFDGTRPVNVLPILGILVILQILLLLFVLLSLLIAKLSPDFVGKLPLVGDLRAILGGLAGWIGRWGKKHRWMTTVHRLRARSQVHGKLELWWMTSIAQCFGIAFNVGAIAVLLLPSTLKYSFCWSTTLNVGPQALHQLTTVLAAPWRFFVPNAVPSLELIESTQFDLLSGKYLSGAVPESGAWWPFLIACVIVYGLIPRVVLAVVSALAFSRTLRALPLDTPDVEAIVRRLRAPVVEIGGEAPPRDRRGSALRLPAAAAQASPASCVVISWRDVPEDRSAIAGQKLGWSIEEVLPAGGADYARDEAVARRLASGASHAVVVAEAWEPPDKSVRRFLKSLRAAMGPKRKIVVLLISASPELSQIWSEQLAVLEDPYLGIELA